MTAFNGNAIHLFELSPMRLHLNNLNATSFVCDTSAKMVAWCFNAEEDATITHLGYNCSAVTSPPTYKISLQGVIQSGTAILEPDGTIKGGGSPASGDVYPDDRLGLGATR